MKHLPRALSLVLETAVEIKEISMSHMISDGVATSDIHCVHKSLHISEK